MSKKKTAIEFSRELVAERVRDLREMGEAVRQATFNYDHALQTLRYALKEYPTLLDEESRRSLEYVIEQNARRNDLFEFTLDGDEYPFFSESKLYDLLGKDAARTVLSKVQTLFDASVDKVNNPQPRPTVGKERSDG